MKPFSLRLLPLIGALGAVPAGLVLAQSAPDPAKADHPPSPPLVYTSVLRALPSGVEPGATGWAEANATVGQFTRGHVDLLNWEDAQARPDRPAPGPAAAPDPAHTHPAPAGRTRTPGARP